MPYVYNRIKLRFGDAYEMKIESAPDEGTVIQIHIPYIEYSPENVEYLESGSIRQWKEESKHVEK